MVARRARRCVLVALLVAGAVWQAGCAPVLGSAFRKIDNVPPTDGLVYVYRPSAFMGGGVAYDVKVGDNVVTTLYSGGYIPYFSKPGEVEFWARTESRSAVTVDVKPGGVYYVKGTVGVGFFVGRPHLSIVSTDLGEKEIAECKLILRPKEEGKKEEAGKAEATPSVPPAK